MKSLNKVQIIGNLGQDPELRSSPGGASVCNISIATTESKKDQRGQWQDKTDWHRVVLWNYNADNAAKYLRKGSKVYIEGKLETRSWEQDGITKYITEIIGKSIIFLDYKEKPDKTQQTIQPEPQPRSERETYMNNLTNDDDELPF